jgi:hypothetical protein
VGNLLCRQAVEVRLSYVSEVDQDGRLLRFTLPTAVAPRFTATAHINAIMALVGAGDATAVVADRAATMIAGATMATRLRVRVEVSCPSTIVSLTSPSHSTAEVAMGAAVPLNGNGTRGVVTLGASDDAGESPFSRVVGVIPT